MKSLLLFTSLIIPMLAYAGGPRHIDGNTPVRYANPNVVLNFDIGTLGARSNSVSNDLVLQGMAVWNNVTTATINLTQGNNLASDIDHTSYQDLLFPVGGTNSHPSVSDGLNPVVYDTDGRLIDDFFGALQSTVIVGVATSIFSVGTGNYNMGYVLINGKNMVGTETVTDALLLQTITHEIGHFIGIDHSQLNINGTNKDCALAGDKYPVMYPTFCDQPNNVLHLDDVSAVSALYPEENVPTTFGEINGTLVDTSGTPWVGVNIFVTNTQTGDVYSVVSDYLKQGTGFFSILLPAGSYSLQANDIISEFRGISSVGPYATNALDTSFTYGFINIVYAGSTPGSNQLLTVTTGEAVTVSLVSDGSGTFTTGNAMTVNTAATDDSSGGGGGGLFSPAMLLLILACLYRRTFYETKLIK